MTLNLITKHEFFLPLLLLLTTAVGAQNLENIGKGKPFGLSGGINANNVFYHAAGMQNRRDPFNYFVSGNLNISLYDWSVPLSFSYSNQQSTFQQPFNQYGLSPTYKWVTLHAGYRSMSFSNYTMNGHLFLGGGFDINPKPKLKISAFYGRLRKAVEEDTLQVRNLPSYCRMGGGIKVSIGDDKKHTDVIVFKAKDALTSLSEAPVKSETNPEENLVLSLSSGITLMSRLTWKGEVASSAITTDTRAEIVQAGNIFGGLGVAFTPRVSSSYYQAYKTSIQYSFTNAGVGFAYERIDPGYRTLGAYYFNNNLETFALTNTAILLQKKVRINGQIGVQRNNLDDKELNSMNRLTGSLNVNYMPTPRLTTNVSYSDFKTVINIKSQFDYLNRVSPYERLDTLNYKQIARNINGSINYVLNESKERRQNVSFNFSHQQTADQQGGVRQNTGARFFNINSAYTLALTEHNLSFSLVGNANITESPNVKNRIYGPTTSLRKTFFKKKLSTSASCSYNRSNLNQQLAGRVTNVRLTGSYRLFEKHNFDFNVTQVNRYSPGKEIQKVNETTVQFGYSYNFSVK